MSLRPPVMRRLMRELAQLKNEPPEGIRVVSPDDNMLDVTGIIEGPAGTPYEGGFFRVKFSFTEEFPSAPPKCWFATKIFHPNVSSAGEICVNTLKKDWQSSYGIGHILVTVKCLLIYPNPESALDEEAGKLLLENYEDYCQRAKLITSVHASPKIRPPEFDVPSVPSSSPTPSSSTSKASKIIEISATTVPTYDAFPPTLVTSNSLSTPPISRKSASPAPQPPPQPLQTSGTVSNTLPISTSGSDTSIMSNKDKEQDKEKEHAKEGGKGLSPLGRADSNVLTAVSAGKVMSDPGTTKAVKRPAVGAGVGEKRKKALKRL